MKKLLFFLMLPTLMSLTSFSQTTPPDLGLYSVAGRAQIRANIVWYLERNTDSTRRLITAEIKKSISDSLKQFKRANPNDFYEINGVAYVKWDKITQQLDAKADTAEVKKLVTTVSTLSETVSNIELPPPGITAEQLKAVADKVEALRLQVPNGFTYPTKP